MLDDRVTVGMEDGITSKSDFLAMIASGDLVPIKMDFQDFHVKVYAKWNVGMTLDWSGQGAQFDSADDESAPLARRTKENYIRHFAHL